MQLPPGSRYYGLIQKFPVASGCILGAREHIGLMVFATAQASA